MKHEKHPWFIRDSNPVPLGQKSGALTTELPVPLLDKLSEKIIEPQKSQSILENLDAKKKSFEVGIHVLMFERLRNR
jgi:hypothetical protein